MNIRLDGHSVFVYNGGKPLQIADIAEQPVVVFVHGAGQDHSCWLLQSRWFAYHGHTVLAPDLPGHGRSDGAPLNSVQDIAAWIITLLDAVGVQQAMLVGHSMGALAAIETAAVYPQRLTRVALVGPALPMPVSAVLLEAAANNEARCIAMINNFSYSPDGQTGGSPMPGLWMMGMNQRLMERQKPGVFLNDLQACNAYACTPERLAGITVPTLVILGQADRMAAPKSARAIAAAIPDAQIGEIPRSGHALMAEAPLEVLNLLKTFSQN